MIDLETGFFYLTIAFAILLVYSLLLVAMRERYAQVLIKRQKHGLDKLLRLTPFMIRYLRFLMWGSLLSLIVAPPAFYYYLDVNFYIAFIFFALMFVTMLVEYRLEKWLYQYLTRLQSSQ